MLEPFLAHAPRSLFPRMLIIENGLARWQSDLKRLLEAKGYGLRQTTRLNLVFELGQEGAAHG